MRTNFQLQLESLQADLGAMCALAGEAVGGATRGLLDVDAAVAHEVTREIGQLRRLRDAVERRAIGILARQAPVARDLRMVVTALHVAADADRMGGLAAHVAKLTLRRYPESVIPRELHGRFEEMGATAVDLAGRCHAILTTGDCAQVDRVRSDDRFVETLHRELFTAVASPGWAHGATVASDVVLLGRFYGRFADHAGEIARRMMFQTSGASSLDHERVV
ncbi:phosphate transport system regulatory protein PhoU [Mycobacterium yunnanensis]|uniref:Phosphate transport system regulatory protein PhoU n=1 Tax=Mycobacterium yunnanensis TaxID=368477 RepID=A0A9X2Z0H7_9MYCO|nr:PhoU domain-containing protein [Mycobacterium yunnanensis]MCV7421274.1 phosphate transport system regulatory protein PhoU [Mycobacterium yunnanensis]